MAITKLELELDGIIFLIERNEQGNIISRDPIDGQAFLKIFANVMPYILESDYLENFLSDIDKKENE